MGKQRQSSLASFFAAGDGGAVQKNKGGDAGGSVGEGGGAGAAGESRPSVAKRQRVDVGEAPAGAMDGAVQGAGGGGPSQVPTEEERVKRWRVALAMGKKAEFTAKRMLAGLQEEEPGEEGKGLDLRSLLVNESWGALLAPEFDKPYCAGLGQFLASELRAKKTVYPALPHVFRCFNSADVADVRVVIIGQDPYHDVGQAMGLSFSVPPGIQIPSSLRNIFKELREDLGIQTPRDGDLSRWAAEGVLLLNACLTVRAHEAASHAKRGWETFTDSAIRSLSKHGRRGIVFMLWGKFAEGKRKLVDGTRGHHVLVAPHPSGLSAHRGFYGCRHFSKANALLAKDGSEPIDWSL